MGTTNFALPYVSRVGSLKLSCVHIQLREPGTRTYYLEARASNTRLRNRPQSLILTYPAATR